MTPVRLAPHFIQTTLGDPIFDIFLPCSCSHRDRGPIDHPWTTVDCSLAAENLMLAARASGLCTCWIGLAHGWLAMQEGKAVPGLSADQRAVALSS